jgi:CubicO group peptidase (beta-lactamase class C family)
MRKLFLAAALLATCAAHAQPAEWWNKSSQGFRSNAQTARMPASSPPRPLQEGAGSKDEEAAAAEFARLAKIGFNDKAARSIILARNGRILFEDRAWHVSRGITPLGFSVSKSLTGIAVGKALCSGNIQSLDDRADKYVPRLAGTSWGNSTVRQLLMMGSGAIRTMPVGWKDASTSALHEAIYTGLMKADYVDAMIGADDKAGPPGDFRYSNYDTIALSLVVEGASRTRFAEFFAKEIWANVRSEKEGAWMHTQNNQVAAYVGFSASPRDWVRLGFYVLDSMEEDSCFGRYMREATKKQLTADFFSWSYGYQIWTDCISSTDAFCFYGYGGQLLVMSLQKRLVMHAHSVSHSVDGVWLPTYGVVWDKLAVPTNPAP